MEIEGSLRLMEDPDLGPLLLDLKRSIESCVTEGRQKWKGVKSTNPITQQYRPAAVRSRCITRVEAFLLGEENRMTTVAAAPRNGTHGGEEESIPLVAPDQKARFTCVAHPMWSGMSPNQWGQHVRVAHGGINPKTGKPLKTRTRTPAASADEQQKPQEPRIPGLRTPSGDERQAVRKFDRDTLEDSLLLVIDHLKAEQEQLDKTIMALEEQYARAKKTTIF